MKIFGFKEFRFSQNIGDVAGYLSNDLKKILREIQLGFSKLSFADNFESNTIELTIAAGAEAQIQHTLGVIPTGYLIVKSTGASIVDGDTPWTTNFLYLKNTGAASATLKVIILK